MILVVAGSAVVSVESATATQQDRGQFHELLRGGQAAPSAAGGTAFRVRVATVPNRQAAEALQTDLVKEGYLDSELVPVADGKFVVLVGTAASEADAQEIQRELKSQGYEPEAIQSPGAAISEAPTEESQVATGAMAYRVMVAEMPSQSEAQDASDRLREEGFTSVDVVEADGKFQVMMGSFNTRADAEQMQSTVKTAGFPFASVAVQQKVNELPTLGAITDNLDTQGLNEQEVRETQEVLERVTRASTNASADEMQDLRESIRQLTERQREIIEGVETERSRQRETQQRIYQLYRDFENFTQARNFDAAEQTLARVRELDPNDMYLASKEERLRGLRAAGSSAAPERTASGPDPARVQELLATARNLEAEGKMPEAISAYGEVLAMDPNNTEARGRVGQLRQEQETAEGAGESGTDLMTYIIGGIAAAVLLGLGWFVFSRKKSAPAVASKSPTGTAMSSIDAVDPLAPGGMSGGGVPETAPMSGGLPSAFSTGPESSAPPQANPSLSGAGGLMGSGFDMNSMPTLNSEPDEVEEVAPTPVAPVEPDEPESDTVSLESMFTGPTVPPPGPAPIPEAQAPAALSTTDSSAFNLDDLDLTLPGSAPAADPLPDPLSAFQDTPAPQSPAAPSTAEPSGSDAFDIESLLKGTFPGGGEGSPNATPVPPSDTSVANNTPLPLGPNDTSVPGINDTSVPGITTPMPGSGTATPTPSAGTANMPDLDAILRQTISETQGVPGQAAATSGDSPTAVIPAVGAGSDAGGADSGTIFQQDFSSLSIGEQPAEWKGDYDHASLVVDPASGRNGGPALKFEKRSGAGSASYHCQFPKAAGHVIVEFDVRCDDKNKYLLGVYVEKDEDFKQSVHTIVHRLDSRTQPSLRVQGEPVPYELGSWRQVRFDLNLLTGIVSAYVDGDQVVKDAKLPTIPSYVNTLSIRDNLASTGVLYLGNIRIYKA